MKLTILLDTYAKTLPRQMYQLTEGMFYPLKEGSRISVKSVHEELVANHFKVTIAQDEESDLLHYLNTNLVYIFKDHLSTEGLTTGDIPLQMGPIGLELLKGYEGCELTPYLCSSNVLTVGYGSTGPHVKPGVSITQEQADELLVKDLQRFEHCIVENVTVELSQTQFDALVSFAYNCGCNAFKDSTLLKVLNNGNYQGVEEQLMRWTNKGLPGLVARRKSEAYLFNNGTYKDFR